MPEFLAGWEVTEGVSKRAALERVASLLVSVGIGAFAVVRGTSPSIWTAYLALEMPDRISILTSPQSRHGASLVRGTVVTMCVFRVPSAWGVPICGVQCTGVVEAVGAIESEFAYRKRFPEYVAWRQAGGATSSCFFSIRLTKIKLIDEEQFGEEHYVELSPC
jgi:hypothetical protein